MMPLNRHPFVLIVCHSLTGHLAPVIRISKGLHDRGWAVSFLGPTAHRAKIEASGAEFFPLHGIADLNDKLYYEDPPSPEYASLHWAERAQIDLRLQCIETIPLQWEILKAVLKTLNDRDPDRQVLVVAEAFFLGVLPMKLGASMPAGLKDPKTICVSVTVPALRSADLPPFGFPLPFDQSPTGRARNAETWERAEEMARPLIDLFNEKLLEAGASHVPGKAVLTGINYKCHGVILQLGVPGFEYSRSDWEPGFKFAGLVQGTPKDAATGPDPKFPWWQELKHNSSLPRDDPNRRKVIVVAQGTVEIDPTDLIIPTITAFANRSDLVVVAILGWKDAKLSDFITVPSNARVADYLSYDAVLEHTDVWVHNAGFGAVNHGIAHGVPMVVAGEGMDKTENSKRVAWSGIGVDLGCSKPSAEQVKEGIETVLQDKSFTDRVGELKKQSEGLDSYGIVHGELLKLVDVGA